MSLIQSLRQVAGDVWRATARADAYHVFLNEETITETSLLSLAQQHHGRSLRIVPYAKRREALTGADWEWWFAQNRNAVGMRIQAKRLYAGGRYNALNPRGSQIKTLIAMSGPLTPLIVGYNSASIAGSLVRSGQLSNCHCGQFRGPSFWGCTIAPADLVQSLPSNGMGDVLGVSRPWHCIVCRASRSSASLPGLVARNLNAMGARVNGKPVAPVELPDPIALLIDYPMQQRTAEAGEFTPEPIAVLEAYLSERTLRGVLLFA